MDTEEHGGAWGPAKSWRRRVKHAPSKRAETSPPSSTSSLSSEPTFSENSFKQKQSLSLYLSLSLYIYIYIYMYIQTKICLIWQKKGSSVVSRKKQEKWPLGWTEKRFDLSSQLRFHSPTRRRRKAFSFNSFVG